MFKKYMRKFDQIMNRIFVNFTWNLWKFYIKGNE